MRSSIVDTAVPLPLAWLKPQMWKHTYRGTVYLRDCVYGGLTIAYMGVLTCQRPAPVTPASLKRQLFTLAWIAGLCGSPFSVYLFLFFVVFFF